MSKYREILIGLIPADCRRGVEVGVHKGATSVALLRAFPDLTLWMVDPWGEWTSSLHVRTDETQYSAYVQAIQSVALFGHRANILRQKSVDAAGWFVKGEFDFAFIDAEHTKKSVLEDLAAWWPKTKLIICHDYGKPEWGVTEAVHEFADANELEVHAEEGNIAWVRK